MSQSDKPGTATTEAHAAAAAYADERQELWRAWMQAATDSRYRRRALRALIEPISQRRHARITGLESEPEP